ncbi:MAG: hypothetical protein ABGY95_02585 [Rubritalea sp.]|uniref:hypothetical protein n=1 Tax=Rubritalea sp. TaxID=2109375 RepID=UPI003241D75C
MTKTKFDRWLIENLVYEHHIRVVRLPESLPSGVNITELKTQNYHYLLTVKNKKRAEKLIQQLIDQGNMFSTKIAEGSHWYNAFIFNKNKSFTYSMFWWLVKICITIYIVLEIRQFMSTDLYFEIIEHTKTLLQ